ncbi:hypothetical protein TNIN_69791 [Trichonephila inaurata madagascariensis]|uniref:Uncharacterized protein n=1 Tax=Trichonephila inaurata madagascariensis TaxID=2747483 RepID=A0A8X6XSU8_9ARAC|nr:hypothetical protein TNIN_69791 [Trichonephila inaurata madagascariensis]
MKLRVRITFLLPVLIIITGILLLIAYLNCIDNSHSLSDHLIFVHKPTQTIEELVPLNNFLLENMLKDKYPVKRITRRRRIKKQYKDDNDSNRALEVEDEQDFDIFSDNKLFRFK